MFFAFADLKKAFDHVQRDAVWWTWRKLGIEEWLVEIVRNA